MVGIHHPDGGLKEYSAGNALGKADFRTDSGISVDDSVEVAWDDGFTEGGSNGSALFRDGNQLIGTLIGGLTDCDRASVRDCYGPFRRLFPRVCSFLDPDSDRCGDDDHGDSRSAATCVSLPSQTSNGRRGRFPRCLGRGNRRECGAIARFDAVPDLFAAFRVRDWRQEQDAV